MNPAAATVVPGFYITGGTLRRDAPCYVERSADAELYGSLREGRFCYVLTARQMGKSSLMVRTAARLREEGVGVAVLDLTAIGQNLTAEQWYGGLLIQMGQQLELEDELELHWRAGSRLGPLQRWAQAIRQVVLPRYPGRVVVFIDEIDAVRSLPFSTDELFAAIREFYNSRTGNPDLERLAFCLLGVATPSDLIRDTRTTPFNIGQRIELHDFTRNEASQLARGLKRSERLAESLLDRIVYWTGGHPYLTQRLCQAIAEDPNVATPDGVDRKCGELFLSSRARERDDNLLFVRERILRSEADLAGLLMLYAQLLRGKRVTDDETNPLVGVLRLSGIARSEDGALRVRNRIYARAFDAAWVAATMPDAELRRQRAAYRRGLLRATAIAALILGAIALLALTAIRQRNRAEEEARRADRNLQRAQANADEARRAQADAESSRRSAEERRNDAEERKAEAEAERREAVRQRVIADNERRRAEGQALAHRRLLYAADMNRISQAWEAANVAQVEELLERHWPGPGEEDLRSFEWYFWWRLANSSLQTLRETGPALAFSPDGKLLATAGRTENGIKLWDRSTGRQLAVIPAQYIKGLVFSPDGKSIATAGTDGTARLWDVPAQRERAALKGHTAGLRGVAFSPDGRLLATASEDRTAKLWKLATGREQTTFTGHDTPVTSVAFSPDGRILATGSEHQTVKLWEVATGKQVGSFAEHTGAVWSVAFSPDGTMLATAGGDFVTHLWDVSTRQKKLSLRANHGTLGVAFSPDGKMLATASYDRITRLYGLPSGELVTLFRGHGASVDVVSFSPDGKILATGGRDEVVRLWDIQTRQVPGSVRVHQGHVRALCYSTDGRYLATASVDDSLALWNATTMQKVRTFTGQTGAVISVAFSPDSTLLASSGLDGTIRLWEVATGKELMAVPIRRPSANAIASAGAFAAFSPNGRQFVTGNNEGSVSLWDLASKREIASFRRPNHPVFSAAFSPDGSTLATAGGSATLWSVATGKELRTLESHAPIQWVAFSWDGRKLATASRDNMVQVWETANGREIAVLKGHTTNIYSIAFSPDGKRVVAAGGDTTFRLWDVITSQELISFGSRANVQCVAFSPDGRTLATGSMDGWLRFWQAATPEQVLAQARPELTRSTGRGTR